MKNPFKKGTWYYEIQILMFVIMWKHDLTHKPSGEHNALISWGRLYIWYDSAWRFHGLPGQVRFFFYSLTKKKHWALEQPLVDSILSLLNYLTLHRAGFRITSSTSDDMSTALYRFWWGTRIIDDMADIDRVNDGWATMFKGKSRRLDD